MQPHDGPGKPAWWRVLIGGALMMIGALISIPSGLCTAFLGIGALLTLVTAPASLFQEIGSAGTYFLAVFAVAAVGGGLYFLGLRIGQR